MKDMKKIFISALALAALAGCSKEDAGQPEGDAAGRIAIVPSAGVNTNTISRAAVEGTKFSQGNDVFRLCAFLSGDNAPTDWTVTENTEAFENVAVNCTDANGTVALSTPKYYPASGSENKLWFYAYAPALAQDKGSYTNGSSSEHPKVNYTITGQEDIMSGQVNGQNGFSGAAKSGDQQHPALSFTHLLKKVTFKVKAGDTFDANSDITVSQIVVKGVKTSATLDVVKGTLTFNGDAGQSLTLSGSNTAITTDGASVPGCLMFEPGTEFTVSVTAGGVTYADAKVTLTGDNAGKAGVSHEVTLTFNRSGIVPTATITDWVKGTDADVDIQ